MVKKAYKPIAQEEKDLMESIERDGWQPVKKYNVREKEKAIAAARNTLKKEKRINLVNKEWE